MKQKKCPNCQSLKTYSSSGIVNAVLRLPFIDENGDMCKYSDGGVDNYECLNCGNYWSENRIAQKIIIKRKEEMESEK